MAQPRIATSIQWRSPLLAVLSYGFRPFFLLGAAFAAIAIPLWIIMLAGGLAPVGLFQGTRWHAHEMIFGYLAAIIAGFSLTAVPNWTGRLPLSGLPLAGLVGLWLAGRFASFFVASLTWAAAIDLAFLFVLAMAIWREILAGKNARNAPIALLITIFALANLLFHMEGVWLAPQAYGQRLALGVTTLLIGLIGGRITPSFTHNWMARMGLEPRPEPFGWFDKLALASLVLAAISWIVQPTGLLTAVILIAASLMHFVRLFRWRGTRTLREPILLVLHIGYLWLVVSLALLGLSALIPAQLASSTALHTLTAGAIGTMTLAVMTRASLAHTGHEIKAGGATLAIYALVNVGALLRVVAPLLPADYFSALTLSGIVWSSAFALFVLVYGPLLLRPGAGRI
jgi:uncharacterized protein involved in response to NO